MRKSPQIPFTAIAPKKNLMKASKTGHYPILQIKNSEVNVIKLSAHGKMAAGQYNWTNTDGLLPFLPNCQIPAIEVLCF